jgi:hypothetical protein
VSPYRVPARESVPERRPSIRWGRVLRHPYHCRPEAPFVFQVAGCAIIFVSGPIAHGFFGCQYPSPCEFAEWLTVVLVGALLITVLVTAWSAHRWPQSLDEGWRE